MIAILPDGLLPFIASAGWEGAHVDPLPGDASFRRYFRLTLGDPARGGASAMLMHAPPPQENPQPFLHAARWLTENHLRAPHVLAQNAAEGWVLLEDFGDDRVRDWLDANPGDEAAIYAAALAPLIVLSRISAGPFPPYDLAVYRREVALLTEWYAPAAGLNVDAPGYMAAWDQVLLPLLERQGEGITILRDYHAENIMLLDGSLTAQGLLDFQDALVGHPAYDLVSLLQDARRDVSPATEAAMLDHYLAATDLPRDAFLADYAILGAQRTAKIVGLFVRLWQRDGKSRYLALIPRVWALLERDLQHPALAPVAAWFDANIPAPLRAAHGGSFAA